MTYVKTIGRKTGIVGLVSRFVQLLYKSNCYPQFVTLKGNNFLGLSYCFEREKMDCYLVTLGNVPKLFIKNKTFVWHSIINFLSLLLVFKVTIINKTKQIKHLASIFVTFFVHLNFQDALFATPLKVYNGGNNSKSRLLLFVWLNPAQSDIYNDENTGIIR